MKLTQLPKLRLTSHICIYIINIYIFKYRYICICLCFFLSHASSRAYSHIVDGNVKYDCEQLFVIVLSVHRTHIIVRCGWEECDTEMAQQDNGPCWDSLPSVIMLEIFSYLPHQDRFKASVVSFVHLHIYVCISMLVAAPPSPSSFLCALFIFLLIPLIPLPSMAFRRLVITCENKVYYFIFLRTDTTHNTFFIHTKIDRVTSRHLRCILFNIVEKILTHAGMRLSLQNKLFIFKRRIKSALFTHSFRQNSLHTIIIFVRKTGRGLRRAPFFCPTKNFGRKKRVFSFWVSIQISQLKLISTVKTNPNWKSFQLPDKNFSHTLLNRFPRIEKVFTFFSRNYREFLAKRLDEFDCLLRLILRQQYNFFHCSEGNYTRYE